jgi:hypothetical protein
MTVLDQLHARDAVAVGERGARQQSRRLGRLAIPIVAAAILSTWLLSGVSISEAARYSAFEAFYVALPGVLLYKVLSAEPSSWLRTVAIGVPLGYAANTGAFALTAALNARPAFSLLPLFALAACAPILARRRMRQARRRARALPIDGLDAFVVALAVAAALVLLAFTFFASTPLPGHAHSVVYSADNVFDISIAAEARNHWPITEPWVAGQPLRYYTGVFMHIAAVNQVTGVPLASVVLRLLPTTMFLVVALQLWFLGISLRRSPRIGPVAVVLLLVVEDMNLNPTQSEVFHISPFTQFPLSPSFAFGAPFILGALALLAPRFAELGAASDAARARARSATRTGTMRMLTIMGLLVLGAASAKMFAAVDLLGGLGLYWLWSLLARGPARLPAYCLALSTACVAGIYFLMLAGGGASSVRLAPFNFTQEGDSFARARTLAEGIAGHSLYWLALLAGAAILAIFLFTPLLGGLWLIRERGAIPAGAGLPGAVFVTGLLAYLLLGAPGGVEGVFLVYGYIAAVPLAALGLVRLWEQTPPAARRGLIATGAVLLGLGLAIAGVTPALALTKRARDAWYILGYGSVLGGIALTARRLSRHYAPTIPSRLARVTACAIPLLVVMGLVKPATLAASGALKTISHKRIAVTSSASDYGLTTALYTGLVWVRDHTSRCDVLAVNNHFSGPGDSEPDYLYYSAFTERRIFLESWFYTPAGTHGGEPFPGRLALNNRAVAGNPAALRQLALDGVRYILIDKLHGGGPPEPASVTRLVFANGALDVYQLDMPSGTARPRARCGALTRGLTTQ